MARVYESVRADLPIVCFSNPIVQIGGVQNRPIGSLDRILNSMLKEASIMTNSGVLTMPFVTGKKNTVLQYSIWTSAEGNSSVRTCCRAFRRATKPISVVDRRLLSGVHTRRLRPVPELPTRCRTYRSTWGGCAGSSAESSGLIASRPLEAVETETDPNLATMNPQSGQYQLQLVPIELRCFNGAHNQFDTKPDNCRKCSIFQQGSAVRESPPQ